MTARNGSRAMTIAEAAETLGISRQGVDWFIRRGVIRVLPLRKGEAFHGASRRGRMVLRSDVIALHNRRNGGSDE